MARRGARTEEYLAVPRTLWAGEVSSFRGELYTIPQAAAERAGEILAELAPG